MGERKCQFELTACSLKWIAAATMLMDHIGVILYPHIPWLRIIGRISFPIFAFLIAEGFRHTHDVRRYLLRMLIFACVSEIPFDLAFYGTWFEPGHQNVMFTFFLALILLDCAVNLQSKSGGQCTIWELTIFIGVMVLAYAFHTDYSFFGILLVYVYARCAAAEERWKKVFPTFLNVLMGGMQTFGVFAIAPLYFYGGREGRKMKYFFYIFYPGHLLVLYFTRKYL